MRKRKRAVRAKRIGKGEGSSRSRRGLTSVRGKRKTGRSVGKGKALTGSRRGAAGSLRKAGKGSFDAAFNKGFNQAYDEGYVAGYNQGLEQGRQMALNL